MAEKPKNYWDSCVFLAIINEEEGRVDHCVNLFRQASNQRKIQIVTSALTIAECANTMGSEEADELIRGFFEDPAVTVIAADRLVCEEARALQRRVHREIGRRLPVRDSIHLATAIRSRADVLLTYDADDLRPLSGLQLTTAGTSIEIAEPVWEGPRRLF